MDQQSAGVRTRKVCEWGRVRSVGSLINVVSLFVILLTLTLLLQCRVYWAQSLFLYPKRYVLACVLLVAVASTVAYVIYKGGRVVNRYLSVLFVCIMILGEYSAQYSILRRPFRMQYREPSPYLGFTGKPGLLEQNKVLAQRMGGTDAQTTIHFNELAYRGPLPSQDKQGEYRIIMLGGSTVFAGSPLKNSLPGQLELMLSEAGVRNVRVYNWGMVSAVSGQALAAIAHRAIYFDPDVIIVYNGANDANAPFSYDPRPGFPYNYFFTETGQQFAERRTTITQLFSVLLQKSRAMRVLFGDKLSVHANHLARLRHQCEYGTQAWKDQIALTYGENLARMGTICKGAGSKFAVFLQPIIIHKKYLQAGERSFINHGLLTSHSQDTYPRLAVAASRALGGRENEGIYFSDITHVLEHVKEELFWDHVHVNNRGNELIARGMVADLLTIIHDNPPAPYRTVPKRYSSVILPE